MTGFIVAVEGIGFWCHGIPDWQSACVFSNEGRCVETPRRPVASLLAPNERRRVPDNVAVALNVAQAACVDANMDPALLPSIFTCSLGDQAIFDYMCTTLVDNPLALSPTKFHHSVHNAAAGYWTIGARARTATTALCAGPASFAQGLIDAYGQLVDGAQAVLLVGFDGHGVGPIGRVMPSRGLVGGAVVLRADHPHAAHRLHVQWTSIAWAASHAIGPLARHCQDNACAPMLAFFDILAGSLQHGWIPAGPSHSLYCARYPAS